MLSTQCKLERRYFDVALGNGSGPVHTLSRVLLMITR